MHYTIPFFLFGNTFSVYKDVITDFADKSGKEAITSTNNGASNRTKRRYLSLFFASAILACPAIASSSVFNVAPSGDVTGVTDANNLEAALTAIEPGGVVQLAAGQFYTSRPIAVDGFNGTIRGAGKYETIVEAVKNPNPKGNQLPTFGSVRVRYLDGFCGSPGACFEFPMFYFEDPIGDLTVSDLTLQVLDAQPVPRQLGGFNGLYSLILVTMAADVDTHFYGVRLISGESGVGNVQWGIRFFGGESVEDAIMGTANWPAGNHSIKSSQLVIPKTFALAFSFLRNGIINVGGDNRGDGNVISARHAVRLLDIDGSDVRIGENVLTAQGFVARLNFFDAFGISLIQVRTENPSNVLIDNNIIHSIGVLSPVTFSSADGIFINDLSEVGPTLRLLVENNDFISDNIFGFFASIFSFGRTEDVLVLSNRFSGNGLVTIGAGLEREDANWVLHANNFTGFDAVIAHLFLGETTRDWTVVAGGNSLSAVNLGDNNTIVGVTNMRGEPLGPELKDAKARKAVLRDIFE